MATWRPNHYRILLVAFALALAISIASSNAAARSGATAVSAVLPSIRPCTQQCNPTAPPTSTTAPVAAKDKQLPDEKPRDEKPRDEKPRDEKPRDKADYRTVRLAFVGGDKQVPLADLEITVTEGYGSQQKKFGPFTTDKSGIAAVSLPPGFFTLHLKSTKELPFLPVEVLWKGRSRTTRPSLNLKVNAPGEKTTAEKWLAGEPQPPAAKPENDKAVDTAPITYTLLPGCELILRAVDIGTGKPLAGATFYTENDLAEDWGHAIKGDNLGWQPTTSKKADADKKADANKQSDKPNKEKLDNNQTDATGVFRRLVAANAGYIYGVEICPEGYEPADEAQIKLEVRYGQQKAEHTFKFRRKAK